MLEGWYIFLKVQNISVNIREPRYKLHNMGYHIPNYAVTHQRALGHSSFSRLSMHNGKGSPHKWFRVDGVINTVPLGINKQDLTYHNQETLTDFQ